MATAGDKWQHEFWTDVDNRRLLEEHYSWLLPTYDNLPLPVMRADMVRYAYLHQYGGVYLDLDVHCLSAPEALRRALQRAAKTSSAEVLFCRDPDSFSNSIMASTVGADFWLDVLREVQTRFFSPGKENPKTSLCKELGPAGCTGPHLLTEIARQNPEVIAHCDSPRVFPYTWQHWI